MPLDAVAKSKPEIVHSACPHDCPSTCALEVERLSPTQIGRVHGAKANPYTAGVICAKVARYAERQHHPERLAQPMRRVGDKGVGFAAFKPMAWDEALDEVGRALHPGRADMGRGSGLAVFLRRHHGAGAARRHPAPAA